MPLHSQSEEPSEEELTEAAKRIDPPMPLRQYVTDAYANRPIDQRRGQWMFNLLARVRPSLAEKIRSGPLDPFYDDSRVDDFLAYVTEHWKV